MDALAADLDGDVDAVVDEQRDAERLGDGVEAPGDGDGVLGAAVLVAVLHNGGAAGHGRCDDGDEVAGAEDGRGGVGDEVDAVVDGGLAHVGCIYMYMRLFECVAGGDERRGELSEYGVYERWLG